MSKPNKFMSTRQLLLLGFLSSFAAIAVFSTISETNVAYADFDDNIGGQLSAPGHDGEPGLEPKADGMNGCPLWTKGSAAVSFSQLKCLLQPNGLNN